MASRRPEGADQILLRRTAVTDHVDAVTDVVATEPGIERPYGDDGEEV
jgi:hypothetical protein